MNYCLRYCILFFFSRFVVFKIFLGFFGEKVVFKEVFFGGVFCVFCEKKEVGVLR